jgi:hypothetical protein
VAGSEKVGGVRRVRIRLAARLRGNWGDGKEKMRNGCLFCQKTLQNRANGFDLMLIFAKCFFVQK